MYILWIMGPVDLGVQKAPPLRPTSHSTHHVNTTRPLRSSSPSKPALPLGNPLSAHSRMCGVWRALARRPLPQLPTAAAAIVRCVAMKKEACLIAVEYMPALSLRYCRFGPSLLSGVMHEGVNPTANSSAAQSAAMVPLAGQWVCVVRRWRLMPSCSQ